MVKNGTADPSIAKEKKKLKFLLSGYAAEIVSGLNKAALFFKILPEKTLAFKENKSI